MTGRARQRSSGPPISRPLTEWAFLRGGAVVLCWLMVPPTMAMVAGCGGGSLHPVEGSVTFTDGSPVTGGSVVFSSVDLQPPVSAQGGIGRDGTFRLGTQRPGDGAPAGKYRAVVSEPLPIDLDNPPPPSIHPRFRDFSTSGLELEVVPGTNRFTILVERPASGRGGMRPR